MSPKVTVQNLKMLDLPTRGLSPYSAFDDPCNQLHHNKPFSISMNVKVFQWQYNLSESKKTASYIKMQDCTRCSQSGIPTQPLLRHLNTLAVIVVKDTEWKTLQTVTICST